VKTLGRKCNVPRAILENLQDDEDALIQHFLENNKS